MAKRDELVRVFGSVVSDEKELEAVAWAHARGLDLPVRGDAFRHTLDAKERLRNWDKATLAVGIRD